MRKIRFIIASILIAFLASCNENELKSELISFEYGGYGDTIFAFLSGNVYDETEDVPLKDVLVSFNGTTDTATANAYNWCDNFYPKETFQKTDNEGSFQTGFISSKITILLEKEGYSTLRLINYEATPDQYSQFKAILRNGNDTVTVDVSKEKFEQ